MRSDDLAPTIAPQPGPAIGFRQGTIDTYNAATGENTVIVGDALLVDLPIIGLAEARVLAAGDSVAILTVGSSTRTWGILGRIVVPPAVL